MSWTKTTRIHYDRRGLRYASDCTYKEWEIISVFLERTGMVGPPCTHDMREISNAIEYIGASGCQWRLLPPVFHSRRGETLTIQKH